MIPWLLIWEFLSKKNTNLADLIDKRKRLFKSSGEINFIVSNAQSCIASIKAIYSGSAYCIDELDGLSLSFKEWRFNLRNSNTEPVVRLNIESKGNDRLLKNKILELSNLIKNM